MTIYKKYLLLQFLNSDTCVQRPIRTMRINGRICCLKNGYIWLEIVLCKAWSMSSKPIVCQLLCWYFDDFGKMPFFWDFNRNIRRRSPIQTGGQSGYVLSWNAYLIEKILLWSLNYSVKINCLLIALLVSLPCFLVLKL